MIIGKVRPSIYLCCMAMVWSGVSAATCGAKDYKGLVLVRFFLGLVEAPLFPGVSLDPSSESCFGGRSANLDEGHLFTRMLAHCKLSGI